MAVVVVKYREEVVAVAGPARFYLAPDIETRAPQDPVRMMAVFTCAFANEVHTGALPGPYSDDRAELFARCALIDDDEFLRGQAAGDDDETLASRFGVPVEQIAAKRRDLRP